MNLPWSSRCRGIRRSRGHGRASVVAPIALIAFLLLMPGLAWPGEVKVVVDNIPGDCGVRGAFVAAVPAAVAWEVLTDYDGISQFVKSMHSSRMERSDDGRRLLRQDVVASVFLVRRHMRVLLEIQETPGKRIVFHDVLGKDFRSYTGEWRLASVANETSVEYELVAVPRAAFARSLCRGMLRNAAHNLLAEVQAEMMRRAAGGAALIQRINARQE